ncbi:hypothetical protein RhiirC2_846453 [Rhizophagus irregularis]|uniref:Zinc finger bed domain-containing protein 1-like n=1 Tax=Rhizophagus irregularis TaxID=588596 RepID=A0A2N1NLZ6_9GLOM|nr:hypothetical protein RhiirC2_846453 [Rhizophagus irregularis]
MANSIRELAPIERLSCAAHTLQLAIGRGLKLVEALTTRNDNEWELLDELCNILAPFGKATRDFSGNTFGMKDDFDEVINSNSEEINYNNIREHYWAIPNEFGIMAALLDPRYKNLDFISDNNIKRRIYQYDQLKWEINQQSIPSSPTTITSTSSFAESLIAEISIAENPTPSRSLRSIGQDVNKKQKKYFKEQRIENTTLSATDDEITSYFLMPIARENKNLLDWWKAK